MRKLLTLLSALASPALAQTPAGVINAPIYATGYISQVGGTNVTTNIPPQPNHPTNLNIYTTGAISGTWTIKLPNPAFEGQMLSFNCGAAANAIAIVSSDGSSIDSNLPSSCSANGGFVAQFDLRSNIWRSLGSGYSANFRPFTGVTSQWPWQLNADGTWTLKQPNFSDLAADTSSVIASPATHWTTYYGNAGTAKIGKLNRLFIGEAALTSGDVTSTYPFQSVPSWTKDLGAALVPLSQLAVGSTIGGTGITGYARTSDYLTWTGTHSQGSQGVIGVSLEDDTSGGSIGAAVVGIAFKKTGTPGISLNQFDINTQSDCAAATPFGDVVGGQCWAAGLTSGAFAYGAGNPTGALYISVGRIGGPVFKAGIVSMAAAYDTTIGVGGGGVFADLYRGQSIRWRNASDTTDSEIYGDSNGFRVSGNQITSGNMDAATYSLNGASAIGTVSGYRAIYGVSGQVPLLLGASGDATNYYRQTSHSFANADGSVTYGSIIAGNVSFNGSIIANAYGGSSGALGVSGSTSGTIGIKPQAVAGTYNFNLPTSAGTSGQLLASGGGGSSAMTWQSLGTGISTALAVNANTAGGILVPSAALASGAILLGGGSGSGPTDSSCTIASGYNLTCTGTASFQGQLVASNTFADANGGSFTVQKSRGASSVNVGDSLGTYAWRAYEGASYRNGVYIQATADAVVASTSVTGSLKIYTGVNAGTLSLTLTSTAAAFGAGIVASALPTTGGTIKGTLCVDTTGVIYVKTTAGACL